MILLNMGSEYAWPLMQQALSIGLMNDGYVWLLTDGVTIGKLPAQNISPFTGLLGTRPVATKSILYQTFFGRNDNPSVSAITVL